MTTDTIPAAVAKLRATIAHCDQAIAEEGQAARVRFLAGRAGLYWWGQSGPAGWRVRDRRLPGYRIVEFRAGEVRDECREMLRRLETS